MWLQGLLSTDTDHAPGQRISSNRISAADSDYTEGQVMLTGAKLRELIGPRSMAKRRSRQCAESAPAPPRPGHAWRLWAALHSQATGSASCLGRPSQPPPVAVSTAVWPSRPAASASAARGARLQRLPDQGAVEPGARLSCLLAPCFQF